MQKTTNNTVYKLFDNFQVNEPQSYQNLTIVPLLFENENKQEYVSLSKALKNDWIEITELDESAVVSNLRVVNKSDKNILIIDGEQFVGAKQNRIINASIFIPAGKKSIIEVSCVEEGRWHMKTDKFGNSDNMLFYKARANKMEKVTKNLYKTNAFLSDQGEIWDDVHKSIAELKINSSTSAMEDIFSKTENVISEHLSHYKLLDGQNGIIIFLNNQPVSIEYISRPEVFAQNFEKIVRSFIPNAINNRKRAKQNINFIEESKNFVNQFKESNIKHFKSTGDGYDFRFDSNEIKGSALVVNNEVIHFVGFNNSNNDSTQKQSSWHDLME